MFEDVAEFDWLERGGHITVDTLLEFFNRGVAPCRRVSTSDKQYDTLLMGLAAKIKKRMVWLGRGGSTITCQNHQINMLADWPASNYNYKLFRQLENRKRQRVSLMHTVNVDELSEVERRIHDRRLDFMNRQQVAADRVRMERERRQAAINGT